MTQTKTLQKEQILNAFHFRHATKEFDPTKKIPDEDFQFILETGRLSPSSFGFEPWKFVVVQNETVRNKLRPITWGAQKSLPTASHFVLILSRSKDEIRYDSEYLTNHLREVKHMPEDVIKLMSERVQKFQQDDFHLLNSESALADWASKQTYIALGNMMTAAAQIGIDSCPIEGFDKQKVNALLRKEGIVEKNQFEISTMVAFGYRAEEPSREKTRRSLDQVVDWIK